MANTKAAKKALKQNKKRKLINQSRLSAVKTSLKKVNDAINLGKPKDQVVELLNSTISSVSRAAGKKALHKNNASRKISRLTKKVQKYLDKN